jgi:hypothetical protein
MWKPLAAGLLTVVFCSTSASADVTCTIREKYSCAEGEGCAPVENTIVVRIDIPGATYSRCDAKGCDDYGALFSSSGEYINIDVPGRGMVAKMASDGSEFVEVATLMSVVLLSFGNCNQSR